MDSTQNQRVRFRFTPGKDARGHRDKGFIVNSEVAIYCGRPNGTYWPRHHHDHVQILLAFEPDGSDIQWTDEKGKEVGEPLRDGYAYVIGPGVPHAVRCGRGDIILLFVSPSHLARVGLMQPPDVIVAEFSWLAEDDFVAWQLLHLLRHWCKKHDRKDAALMMSSALQLADYLLGACRSLRNAGGKRRDRFMPDELGKVTEHIKARVASKLRIDELARLVARSPKQFMRVFKNTTGMTALEYHRLHRLLRAEEMLLSGKFRIAEVVSGLGFCDQSLLNRYFRKYGRATPGILVRSKAVPKVATPIQDFGH